MAQSTHSKYQALIGFGLIGVALAFIYRDITNHEILRWDDLGYLNNKLVHSLSLGSIRDIFASIHFYNWHPITSLSFALEYAVWEMEPLGYKISNLILHFINSLLIYVLSQQLFESQHLDGQARQRNWCLYASLFTAFIFAVHPLHVESTVWIAERKDILCTMFYLGSVIAYLKYAGTNKKWYALCVLSAIFAYLSKPMAISLPVVLLLLDIYPLKRIETFNPLTRHNLFLCLEKLPFMIFSFATVIVVLGSHEPVTLQQLSMGSRIVIANDAIIHYMTSVILPLDLSPFYPITQASLNPGAGQYTSTLTLIAILLVSIYFARRNVLAPLIVVLILLVTVSPTIGIVKVGYQAMADRYAYLSTIPVFLLIGNVLPLTIPKLLGRQRILLAVLGAIYCTYLIGGSSQLVEHWRNDVTLWNKAIDFDPANSQFAHANLAVAYYFKNDLSNAELAINRSLAIAPNDLYVLEVAANLSGLIGENQKAVEYTLKALSIDDQVVWANNILAQILLGQGKTEEAVEVYQKILSIDPGNAEATIGVIQIFSDQGQLDRAEELLSGMSTSNEIYQKAREIVTRGRNLQQ